MVTTIIVIIVILLLAAAFRLWLTANRLDRLHVRTQAAWAALDGALSRRIVAARALAAAGRLTADRAARLHRLADAADTAARADRDDAETALSRALASIPPEQQGELAAELSDAAERVLLARRFYNDAVRDTLALRASWFTRFFRLAGHAPLPEHFELPEAAGAGSVRRTGRVVLVDAAGRVLLLRGTHPDRDERGWFTPGGGLLPGEDLVTGTLRELSKEIGVALPAQELIGPVWRRTDPRDPAGGADRIEYFFVAHANGPALGTDHFADMAGHFGSGLRWFDAEDLAGCDEPVYPSQLPDRLAQARQIAVTRVAPDIPEGIG